MKTLAKLLLSIACVSLLANCEKDTQAVDPDNAVLFSAEYVVWDYSPPGAKVAAGNDGCLRIWKGEGNSVLLGDFFVEISLTCFIQPGENTGTFCDLMGTLIAKRDGDELYFVIEEGKVICNTGENCDEFQTCFNDLATITGGTGIFARARGSLYPHAFIHNGAPDQWHAKFESEGNIWF